MVQDADDIAYYTATVVGMSDSQTPIRIRIPLLEKMIFCEGLFGICCSKRSHELLTTLPEGSEG